jgi:hypothetical protein
MAGITVSMTAKHRSNGKILSERCKEKLPRKSLTLPKFF